MSTLDSGSNYDSIKKARAYDGDSYIIDQGLETLIERLNKLVLLNKKKKYLEEVNKKLVGYKIEVDNG